MEIMDRKYTIVCGVMIQSEVLRSFSLTDDPTDHLKNSCQRVNAFS